VLHNFARDRQREMDDMLLQEVDNEIAAAPVDILDDTNLIRNVQITTEWNNFRDQLANDMFADYQARLG